MKWLGTGFGLIALQALGVLCTYQLGEELEALLPVQVKLHLSANQNGDRWLLIVQEKRASLTTRETWEVLLIDAFCATYGRTKCTT